MKIAAGICVGLVIGFLLGGISPRHEANECDERVARLSRELEDARGGGGLGVPGLGEIFAPLPDTHTDTDTDTDTATATDADAGAAVGSDGERPRRRRFRERLFGAPDGGVGDEPLPEEMLAQFDTMADAQRLRTAMNRAALDEQAELDDAQRAEMDRITAELNAQLAPFGDELMDLWLSGSNVGARHALGITHDITGVLHDAQLRLERLVGDRGGNVDEEAMQIWNYVDLSAFRPAVEAASQR